MSVASSSLAGPRRRIASAAVALVASVCLLVGADLAQADAWTSTTDVSAPPAGTSSFEPQVAMDPQGNATVVWSEQGGEEAGFGPIHERRIAADGTFGAIRDVTATRGDHSQVAVDSQGNVTVVWRGPGIETTRIAPDGSLGAVRDVSEANDDVGGPQVVVDPQGVATVAWESIVVNPDGSASSLDKVRRIAADGTPLGPVQVLSATGRVFEPQVAVDAQGNATAVWANDGTIQARRIAADGTLGAVQDLYTPGARKASPDPDVAVAPSGVVTAVWDRTSDAGAESITQARRIGADGTLGTTQTLSATGSYARNPKVAVDSHRHRDGRLVAPVRWIRAAP